MKAARYGFLILNGWASKIVHNENTLIGPAQGNGIILGLSRQLGSSAHQGKHRGVRRPRVGLPFGYRPIKE